MAGTTYQELLDAVASYYGSGSDQWAEIAQYGVNAQTVDIIKQVPGVTVTVSNSGKYLGYDYSNPFASASNPVAEINSNVPNSSQGAGAFTSNIPGTAVTNPSTGTTTMGSGARTVATGSTVTAVADKVSLGVAGVALGTKLGKFIDSAIYAVNPDWWDEHYPSINPETWDDMATTEGGKNLIRSIFGLQNDDTTMYMNEEMLAYTYMMLLQNGAYSDGAYDTDQSRVPTSCLNAPTTNYTVKVQTSFTNITSNNYRQDYSIENGYLIIVPVSGSAASCYIYGVSTTPTRALCKVTQPSGRIVNDYWNISTAYTKGGKTLYYDRYVSSINPTTSQLLTGALCSSSPVSSYYNDFAMIALYGTEVISALPGVDDDPTAQYHVDPDTLINPSTGQPVTPNDNPADVLQALKNQYPDLFDDSIYEDVPQQDGTTERIYYIPVPYPNTENPEQPETGDNRQNNPQVNPQTNTEELLQEIIDLLTTPTDEPPDTGEGDTPPVVPPTGSASSLWKVYNPTQAQVDAFGAWLWSSDLVEQIKKLFNDPMQAIIGIHKVFATPSIGGTTTIKCGYIDSNVSSAWVSNQYSYVDCGTVNLREYFGNVFDYSPYTEVNLYLPFIGIVKLDTADVMRGTIGVKYSVDVITGACLAEVTVKRDGSGGIIYTYAGSCIVTYPLSSGSYAGAIGGVLSIAAGIVGTVVSGGALAPMALGAMAGASHLHSDVQKSGSFSGCAGAMGVKKPYLIISRPQTAMANNFEHFTGLPANSLVTLSQCSGRTRVKSVHVENISSATDSEKRMIEQLLKEGVTI